MKKKWNSKVIQKIILFMIIVFSGIFVMSDSTSEASGEYLIKINRQANCVTIYKKNDAGKYKPVKAMICSTGAATENGTYSLGAKIRWHELDGPSYGQYCARIYGNILFHSVWYYENGNPATVACAEYNKLGTTASHGCVRLTVADAKYIYDKVPSGTKVEIYTSKDPGPLGKPKAIKIPGFTNYDPTDIWSKGNVWNKKKPKITVKKSKTLAYASNFDVMKGVKAKNTTGYTCTDDVKVKIYYAGKKVKKVNTKKPGTYRVVYSLKDEIGRTAKVTKKFKVKAAKATPVVEKKSDIYIKKKSQLTKKKVLSCIKFTQKGKKLAAKYVNVSHKKVKAGVYKVTAIAQNASKAKKVVVYAYIDNKKPMINGITDGATKKVPQGYNVNEAYAWQQITVSDNVSKVKVTDVDVTITVLAANQKYKILYTLKDQAGNTVKKTLYVVAVPYFALSGAKDIQAGKTELYVTDEDTSETLVEKIKVYALKNVTAKTYLGVDMTKKIVTEVALVSEDEKVSVYNITYSLKSSAGYSLTETYTFTYNKETQEVTE